MKQATKYVNAALAGYVEYQYCLSCDGALSKRLKYDSSDDLESAWRYEYDGLNLLRLDEVYDYDSDNDLDDDYAAEHWRTLEVSTHRPGQLGALLGKRFYVHSNNDATPDGTHDYFYGYDRVGNVVFVYEGGTSGAEAYYFTQDAFGNQLALGNFNGDDWDSARDNGVTEHQTGKWVDPFTGQYYFHARWYDSVVGRFTGRDPLFLSAHGYRYVSNKPFTCIDIDGMCGEAIHRTLTHTVATQVLRGQCRGAVEYISRITEGDVGVDRTHPAGAFNQREKEYYHCFNHIRWPFGGFDTDKYDWISGRKWDQAYRCCDPDALGELLHYQQDCYAHWGWIFAHPPGWDSICEEPGFMQAIEHNTRRVIHNWRARCCTGGNISGPIME